MSEYQYYEFQALDRPLTPDEQAQVRQLSSRVQLTPTQASFVYNYGDFRGNPKQVLAEYFDVMFYIANWGTWRFLFRLPLALVDPVWFEPYYIPYAIATDTTDDYLILDITINEEGGGRWVDGEGWLPQFLPLRDDLMAGDLRLLYLAWLRVVSFFAGDDLDADPMEPPVPPNLDRLSPALEAFIDVVELDMDLVAAAAQASSQHQLEMAAPLESWLEQLSEAERQDYLRRLVRREPHVDLQLISRLRELARAAAPVEPMATSGDRRLSEIVAIANTLEAQRLQQEEEAARQQRQRQLDALATRVDQTWERIRQLLVFKQSRPYDEAAALLQDLHDLAEYQGRLPAFKQQLKSLKADYSNRPGFLRRLEERNL